MKPVFQPEWRTSSRWKRRFYARYMSWLERGGYFVVVGVIAAFVFAFNYRVDDLVKADEVKLTPASVSLTAEDETAIVAVLAEDFAEVKARQRLFEVVRGSESILAFDQWKKVDALRVELAGSPEWQRLSAKYPKPPTDFVVAPSDGVFRFDPTIRQVAAGAEIGRVVDYSDIRLSASLAGDTVSRAEVGQTARITALNLGSGTGTLFRGSSPTGDTLSGQLVDPSVREKLAERLKGSSIQLRDDLPLQVKDVAEIQVDARVVRTAGGDPSSATPLDPVSTFELSATVIEGTPAATIQIADLPKDIQEELRSQVAESVSGRNVSNLDGRVDKLGEVRDMNFVVKLKAENAAKLGGASLTGTMLKRTFEATLKLTSPPEFLVRALRNADRNGKDVTARVELKTGSRPIAFILLKKS